MNVYTYKTQKGFYKRKYDKKMLISLLKLLKFLIKPSLSFVRKLKGFLLTKENKNSKMLKKHIKKTKRRCSLCV